MDDQTLAAFAAHVRELERRAIDGDIDAAKSLACMALLVEGWQPTDPGGEVIDFAQYRRAA